MFIVSCSAFSISLRSVWAFVYSSNVVVFFDVTSIFSCLVEKFIFVFHCIYFLFYFIFFSLGLCLLVIVFSPRVSLIVLFIVSIICS